KAVAKVSGTENFVGNLCRNLCRIGHFSTKASTKFATKMQNQHFRNRLYLAEAPALNVALFVVHHCSHFAGSFSTVFWPDTVRRRARARLRTSELVSRRRGNARSIASASAFCRRTFNPIRRASVSWFVVSGAASAEESSPFSWRSGAMASGRPDWTCPLRDRQRWRRFNVLLTISIRALPKSCRRSARGITSRFILEATSSTEL